MVRTLLSRSAWKFDPSHPAFKVIWSHRNRHRSIRHLIYDFLVTFHSNHGDKRRFQSKIATFPLPVYFAPPPHWRGSPWNCVAALWVQKLERCGYRRESSLTISSTVWIQYTNVMDGQTDGQTDAWRICHRDGDPLYIIWVMVYYSYYKKGFVWPWAAHAPTAVKLNRQVLCNNTPSPNFIQIGRPLAEWRPKKKRFRLQKIEDSAIA